MADDLAGEFLQFHRGAVVRGIPIENATIRRELQNIYHDLNDRRGQSQSLQRNQLFGPENNGYSGPDIDREYIVEAFRAYFEDPNYIHTVAPNVARLLSERVSGNPRLSSVIHLNAGGIPIPMAPLPDTLQQVRLPGGSSVAPLPDLVSQAMLSNAPAPVRLPLGPAWAVEYNAAYQDPNSPEFAARVAREAAWTEAHRLDVERRAREQAIRDGWLMEA